MRQAVRIHKRLRPPRLGYAERADAAKTRWRSSGRWRKLSAMLRILGQPQRTCDGLTRRDMLQVGGLTALGLSLTDVLRPSAARAANAPGRGRARACILIYLFGGPSQIDTFDLKPDAPDHFRGEFRPIATNVPGIRIVEHLPRLAGQAAKYCLIRGMHHEHPRHG